MTLIISSILSFLSPCIFFLFGDIDINLKYLLTVIILDFISGIIKAFIKKKINSSISIKGIIKKFCYFIVIAISVIIGNLLNLGSILRNIVIYSLILNEIISILENCVALGVKLPKALTNSLEVFNDEIEKMTKNNLEKKDNSNK